MTHLGSAFTLIRMKEASEQLKETSIATLFINAMRSKEASEIGPGLRTLDTGWYGINTLAAGVASWIRHGKRMA